MTHRRAMLLALLALLVPLPAFALNDGSSDDGAPAAIAVSASLGDCGLADTQIVCQINASWNAVQDADYYSLSVTRADGSVVDYGQSSGTGTSVWVPYVGPGTYSIEVAAWGTPAEEGKPHVIVRDEAFSTGRMSRPAMRAEAAPAAAGDSREQSSPGDQPAAEEPGAAGPGEKPVPEPACDPDGDSDTGTESDETEAGADEATGERAEDAAPEPETESVTAETQAALEAEAELPESVTCP